MPDHRNAPFSKREQKTPRDIATRHVDGSCQISAHAWAATDALIDKGATDYRRSRDIPTLLPGFNAQAEFGNAASSETNGPSDLISQLRRALIHERALGQSGHWGYDLGRHIALAQACRAEARLLAPGFAKHTPEPI